MLPTLFLLLMSCDKATDHYTILAESNIAAVDEENFMFAASIKYYSTCPDGTYGCGSSPGPPCTEVGQNQCKPLVPLKQFSCGLPGIYGCAASNAPSTSCSVAATCPTPPDQPKNHAIPCMYGTIAYGCFPGWTSGPYCTTLVNCQIPPP